MTIAARAAIVGLRIYQQILSPFLPPACRFAPTCSEYACAAVAEHGLVRGILLTFRRLARCHPFHPGGFDPPHPRVGPPTPRVGPPTPRAQGAPARER